MTAPQRTATTGVLLTPTPPTPTPPTPTPQCSTLVTVVVLAGGQSRRFGSDKLAAPVAGATVLDSLLSSLPTHWPVVSVGPERRVCRSVTWTREDPPGGGPLAGIAAGVALVDTDCTLVVAGDMPWAGPACVTAVQTLVGTPAVAAAFVRDRTGHVNPLLAAYRTDALRHALPIPAHDRPAKLLLALPHVEVVVTGRAAADVDTPADLAAADVDTPADLHAGDDDTRPGPA